MPRHDKADKSVRIIGMLEPYHEINQETTNIMKAVHGALKKLTHHELDCLGHLILLATHQNREKRGGLTDGALQRKGSHELG